MQECERGARIHMSRRVKSSASHRQPRLTGVAVRLTHTTETVLGCIKLHTCAACRDERSGHKQARPGTERSTSRRRQRAGGQARYESDVGQAIVACALDPLVTREAGGRNSNVTNTPRARRSEY